MSVYVKINDPSLKEEFPEASIYTSLEGENPSGSIKDHMIREGLEDLLSNGNIAPGGDIAEISAGSSALSLAYFSQIKGLNCHIFLPENVSLDIQEKLQEMEAKLYLVKKENAYSEYQKFLEQTSIVPFNQMFDQKKSIYYERIGSLLGKEKKITATIGAVGTGHSLAGIAKGVSKWSKNSLSISAEPAPALEIPGVRNIEIQSLGENDPCLNRFHDRIIVEREELFPRKTLTTDKGDILIGESFQLTLGAVRKFLCKRPNACIFAIGANNKRSARQERQT